MLVSLEELAERRCGPCHAGTPQLTESEAASRLVTLGQGWRIEAGHLVKEYRFQTFAEALAFANQLGARAEELGHHPDLHLGWGYCRVELVTHAISGLSEADFVLAAQAELVARGA